MQQNPLTYQSTPPTLPNGGNTGFQCDVNGNLKTTGGGTSGQAAPNTSVIGGGVYNTSAPTYTNGQQTQNQADVNGNQKTVEQYAPVYENNTTGKAVVEENYTNATVTADGQVKSSAGFIRSITFSATGTVTAGLITVYDNTAESGTVIWSGVIQVTTAPITIALHVSTSTGIYVGYDGTIANVRTQVSYR